MRVERVEGLAGLARVHALRWEVFVTEQGVLPAEELDGRDESETTVHLIAVDEGGHDVGTARLLTDPDDPGVVHVTRVAVKARARGQGVGRALMTEIEGIAWRSYAHQGRVRVELSVQESAMAFYAALGYQMAEHRYLDARMWHRDAVKILTADPDGPSPR